MTLDRYVGRTVVGSVLASLLFFLFLTILLDLLKSLGDYLDAADKQEVGVFGLAWFLASYYLKLVPFIFVSIAPFSTVIGCMFAVSRLMGQQELQPMLFVGRSMMRILQPALLGGTVVALSMVACWQWVVPAVAGDIGSAQTFLSGGDRALKNLVIEDRGDGSTRVTLLRIREYEASEQRMLEVHLLQQGVMAGDVALVHASVATWDPKVGDWRLEDGMRRTIDGEEPCAFLGVGDWTPEKVLQRGQDTVPCEVLSYDELYDIRQLRPNRKDVAMALHRHFTYPLANLILLLLALPFAIHFERGSRMERVLGAIGACGAYLLFDLTCQNLGYNGYLHPVVAAWSPTILFGSMGVTMFSSMRT